MNAKSTRLTIFLCFVTAALCMATEMHMGTWKLNESASQLNPDTGKNHTVIYAAEGENVKITVDGVDGKGNAIHSEWVGKFDGKEYPVTGDPRADVRSYTVADDGALHMINKKADKVVTEGHISVSADGKTRTVTVKGTDSKGNPTSTTAIYDKQ